jgi:hypothetical protein
MEAERNEKAKKPSYMDWLIYLKYLLIGARILPRTSHYKNVPDRKAWRHFYDDGYTPLEAMLIDINEVSN